MAKVVPQAGRGRLLEGIWAAGHACPAADARAASGQVPPAHQAVPLLQQGILVSLQSLHKSRIQCAVLRSCVLSTAL